MIETGLNKGAGAGGENTTKNGSEFEDKTNNFKRLEKQDKWVKKTMVNNPKKEFHYSLTKEFEDRTVVHVKQSGFRHYMKKFDIDIDKNPDEAYFISYHDTQTTRVVILEKKRQDVSGTTMDKIWGAPSIKQVYQLLLGDNFIVESVYTINTYLYNELDKTAWTKEFKYTIFPSHNIPLLCGDDNDYYDRLDVLLLERNWKDKKLTHPVRVQK